MKGRNKFIKRISILSIVLVGMGSVTASASTAISQWYGNGRKVVSSHTCNGWAHTHEVGVIRTPNTLYTSGLSWVSYNYNASVKTFVTVGNRSTSDSGIGYAQTSTISDLPGAPVSESHY